MLLLVYTIAALVFWGISLERQNQRIYDQEVIILRSRVDSTTHPFLYLTRMQELNRKHSMRTKQYIGEGSTFLVVILIGAAVVWSSLRRSLKLSRQQNNFMLSVTHELKSPIAAMKLNLQTLEKYQLDEEKKNRLIEQCIREANRLNDLANNMLFASQIEGGQYKPAKEHIDFAALVRDTVYDYRQRYPDRFTENIAAGSITGDKTLLQMAVSNLLENAVKYTSADTAIHVQLITKHRSLCLQVMDNGSGIPDDEKKKIFNKFYRIGNEDSRKAKGTGLGLYLTAKIIRQHKGRITVKDNKPSGSIFEVSLPLS